MKTDRENDYMPFGMLRRSGITRMGTVLIALSLAVPLVWPAAVLAATPTPAPTCGTAASTSTPAPTPTQTPTPTPTATPTPVPTVASTTPIPSPEHRHPSGIVLLPPLDIAEIVRQGPIYEPLGKASSDALDLARQNPDVLGYPWADRAKGELVIAVVNAQGEAIARSWMRSGAPRALGKPGPDLLPPQVPVRFRTVDCSYRQLETIQHEAIGRGAAGFAGENRIWSSGVDEEHQRVVLTTDRVVDAFLFALAKKYGTEVVAVRVDPHSGAFTTVGSSSEPSDTGSQLTVVAGIVVLAALAVGLWLLVKARRSAA